MAGQFIGSGWAFPMRADASGAVALAGGQREIEQAIRLVLATAPGERPMRPEFGCVIHDLVFAPVNEATSGRIRYEVRASLERWEPRIEVMEVDVLEDNDDDGMVLIDLRYAIRGTNSPRNLVFPFYTIPSDEPSTGGA
ncbi:GPW/gp25 family protein [Kineosporia sp. J2-2]|uniref:GPW/gp25 family protein n=1 Tax=Kineosporia corallincola TaxID=2835133 RepID=A0ABS5TQZ6_9ACTN|nr:GPW/gp25 family protein [Kineosporia corallincola]MBT0772873.1 GPW/gp25 family protein [Kineosporia corallincola]